MRIKTRKLVLITATMSVAVFFAIPSSNKAKEDSGQAIHKSSDAFSFVKSMEGTRIDGDVGESAEGKLTVNAGLRLMFDYYLAATGEKSLDEIVTEIEKELGKTLSPNAALEARHLLSRYIQYKQALAAIEKSSSALPGNATASIRQRLTRMQDTRKNYFNQMENEAMFGFDDAYDMDAVNRLEISQNAALTEAQKREKIKTLDAAMSPALREAKEAPYQVVRLEEYAKDLRAHGASEDEVYRMRAATTSPEAAARLAQVDHEESQWKERIVSYLQEKNRIQNMSTQIKDTGALSALQQIRDQKFTKEEQRRLPAYE